MWENEGVDGHAVADRGQAVDRVRFGSIAGRRGGGAAGRQKEATPTRGRMPARQREPRRRV